MSEEYRSEITTLDLFKQFVEFVKEAEDLNDILKEYGGDKIYIPSYKTVSRDNDLIEDFQNGISLRELQKKYDLSSSQIYKITKDIREPKLF